jgi:hypothetical protein
MIKETFYTIAERISVADPISPISVFIIDNEVKSFATRTVYTKMLIDSGKHEFIGTFHKNLDYNYTLKDAFKKVNHVHS